MESMNHTELCHLYIAELDNEGLYSTSAIVRNALMLGFPVEAQEEEVLAHLEELARLLTNKVKEGGRQECDGIDQVDTANPRHAFLGIRWKAIIPKKRLNEVDRVIVNHFVSDDSLDSLYMFQKPDRKYSWRQAAKDLFAARGIRKRKTIFSEDMKNAGALLVVFLLFLWVMMAGSMNNQPGSSYFTSNDKANTLRLLLKNETFRSHQDQSIIATTKTSSLSEEIFVFKNGMDDIQAVFAFEINPVILIEDAVVQLGDLVTIGDDSGYIQSINSRSLIVKSGTGLHEIEYPVLRIFGRQNWHATRVLIYPHGNNMRHILAMVSQITNRKFEMQEKIDVEQVDSFQGAIVGSFDCDTYEEFLACVGADLGVSVGHATLRFVPFPPGRLRTCIGFDYHFAFFQSTIKEIFQEYEMLFGLELVTKTERLNYDVIFPPKQLHEFVNEGRFEINSQGTNVFTIGDNK